MKFIRLFLHLNSIDSSLVEKKKIHLSSYYLLACLLSAAAHWYAVFVVLHVIIIFQYINTLSLLADIICLCKNKVLGF